MIVHVISDAVNAADGTLSRAHYHVFRQCGKNTSLQKPTKYATNIDQSMILEFTHSCWSTTCRNACPVFVFSEYNCAVRLRSGVLLSPDCFCLCRVWFRYARKLKGRCRQEEILTNRITEILLLLTRKYYTFGCCYLHMDPVRNLPHLVACVTLPETKILFHWAYKMIAI